MPNQELNLRSAWKSPTELPPNDVQVLAELKPLRKNSKPVFALVEYMRTRKGVHDAEPMWFESRTDDDVEVVRWRYLVEVETEPQEHVALAPDEVSLLTLNSERYKKLRGYMSSNVPEGWGKVENLASVAAYVGWDAMDQELDALPECTFGLCSPPAVSAASAPDSGS